MYKTLNPKDAKYAQKDHLQKIIQADTKKFFVFDYLCAL